MDVANLLLISKTRNRKTITGSGTGTQRTSFLRLRMTCTTTTFFKNLHFMKDSRCNHESYGRHFQTLGRHSYSRGIESSGFMMHFRQPRHEEVPLPRINASTRILLRERQDHESTQELFWESSTQIQGPRLIGNRYHDAQVQYFIPVHLCNLLESKALKSCQRHHSLVFESPPRKGGTDNR